MNKKQRKKAYDEAIKHERLEFSEFVQDGLDKQDKRVQKPKILTPEEAKAEILRWRI